MSNPENLSTRPVSGFSLTEKQVAPLSMIEGGPVLSIPYEYLPCGTPVWARDSALSEANRHRLVEAAKCPTLENSPEKDAERAARDHQKQKISETHQLARMLGVDNVISKQRDIMPDNFGEVASYQGTDIDLGDLMTTGELSPAKRKSEGGNGQAFTVISHREWSDEYRVRTQIDQCHQLPPEQEGERITTTLSMSGAQKIADSCHYMHLKKGGYKTFFTLTFSDENRARIADGETTIQKEVGRLWDGLNKMRKRGWVYTSEVGAKVRLPAEDKNIHYCWVVENPLNAAGERNPHVHILMDWSIEYKHFPAWAKRLEGIWKQGFAHLEKIKDTENAGAYMAKAAGYLSKANGECDQGPVKGNRYGISRDSRAPGWECYGRFELGIMGHLIADTHDYFSVLYGGHFAKRAKLKKALDETPKEQKKDRQKIGSTLSKVRKALNRLPAIASKYQILIKGSERFDEFKAWATSTDMQPGSNWLPPKAAGDCWNHDAPKPAGNWLKEFQFRMHAVRATRRFLGMPMKVYDLCFKQQQAAANERKTILNDWVQYSEFCQ